MKVTFIGTGNVGTKRCNTSILIDDILFDCGNGVTLQLDNMNIDFSSINYLVITHFHADHIFDIPSFLLSRLNRKIFTQLTIIGPIGTKAMLQNLMALGYGDGVKDGKDIEDKYNLKFIEIFETEQITINNLALKPYHLIHGINKECQGYVYGDKIAYLVDTASCDNVYQICNRIENIIIDVTFNESTNKHLGIDDFKKIVEKNPNKKFYAVHRNDNVIYNKKYFPEDGEIIYID